MVKHPTNPSDQGHPPPPPPLQYHLYCDLESVFSSQNSFLPLSKCFGYSGVPLLYVTLLAGSDSSVSDIGAARFLCHTLHRSIIVFLMQDTEVIGEHRDISEITTEEKTECNLVCSHYQLQQSHGCGLTDTNDPVHQTDVNRFRFTSDPGGQFQMSVFTKCSVTYP